MNVSHINTQEELASFIKTYDVHNYVDCESLAGSLAFYIANYDLWLNMNASDIRELFYMVDRVFDRFSYSEGFDSTSIQFSRLDQMFESILIFKMSENRDDYSKSDFTRFIDELVKLYPDSVFLYSYLEN